MLCMYARALNAFSRCSNEFQLFNINDVTTTNESSKKHYVRRRKNGMHCVRLARPGRMLECCIVVGLFVYGNESLAFQIARIAKVHIICTRNCTENVSVWCMCRRAIYALNKFLLRISFQFQVGCRVCSRANISSLLHSHILCIWTKQQIQMQRNGNEWTYTTGDNAAN